MVNFALLFYFWIKTILTIVYIKNKSPLTIQKGKIISKEVFLQYDSPHINQLQIFGCMVSVFDKNQISKLCSKA